MDLLALALTIILDNWRWSDELNVLLNDSIMKQVRLFLSNNGICDLDYGVADFYDWRKMLYIHVAAYEFDNWSYIRIFA